MKFEKNAVPVTLKVTFAGHVCRSGKIDPDPVKLATLKDMQPPVTKSDVRRLGGFSSYFRSFIHPSRRSRAEYRFDTQYAPNRVKWESAHQAAFQRLKCLCVTLLH
jgi:hypothetical protein